MPPTHRNGDFEISGSAISEKKASDVIKTLPNTHPLTDRPVNVEGEGLVPLGTEGVGGSLGPPQRVLAPVRQQVDLGVRVPRLAALARDEVHCLTHRHRQLAVFVVVRQLHLQHNVTFNSYFPPTKISAHTLCCVFFQIFTLYFIF